MNTFRADLHVHSRFSRATSGRLNVRNLASWSLIKGLQVMATGDFTHPAWREELRRDLVLDEASGLYRLRETPSIETEIPGFSRPADAKEPLFLIQAEISSIYKKNGAVRKVHNLVFMPTLERADALSEKLGAIGNITSDGRPILGLDSERLLEMVLETDDRAVLIPAHIWTPWFSLFGSKSGFNALEDCFGSLSSHIFALETGLSSDPEMNRLWSALDRYALVSNSDAHSGENLGREANLFSGTPSYDGIFNALRRTARGETLEGTDCAFQGTVEFFPEEGKYHLDGHRACNVVVEPDEALRMGNICPVCGKPLTIGVLHRVVELADRTSPLPPPGDPGFVSLFPLPEMIGELLGVGAKSRKVQTKQAELVRLFGSELDILHNVPETDLRSHWEALGEAVSRMRRGEVIREGGYDGEYGVVRVFPEEERRRIVAESRPSLLSLAKPAKKKQGIQSAESTPPPHSEKAREAEGLETTPGLKIRRAAPSLLTAFAAAKAETETREQTQEPKETPQKPWPYSPAQEKALYAGPHPVLVLAGPGAGKTRTLIGRIERLHDEGVPMHEILAVTFTRRAAGELRERLEQRVGSDLPAADTLHALALASWGTEPPAILSEEAAQHCFHRANPGYTAAEARQAWHNIALAREERTSLSPELKKALDQYHQDKKQEGLADYTDLLEHWLHTVQTEPRRWSALLVDEIQDFSPLQLELVRALCPDGRGFFGIGDPDQAIYGFRGACPDVRAALKSFWPTLEICTLTESHRSAEAILASASNLLGDKAACGHLAATRSAKACLHLFTAPDEYKEAEWIAEQISTLLGGTSHTLEDIKTNRELPLCSPGEIAILVRLKALIPPLQAALTRHGIPCAVPETASFWEDPTTAELLWLAGQRFDCPFPAPQETERTLPDDMPERLWSEGPAALRTSSLVPLYQASSAYKELLRAYKTHGAWAQLLTWVRLRQDLDLVREQAEQVQIMTLHAAKGLEFKAVFLPALEDGLVPFSGVSELLSPAPNPKQRPGEGADSVPADKQDQQMAEERRLLYVGLTRAEDAVFVSHAAARTLYGKKLSLPASPFLNEITQWFHHSTLIRHTRKSVKQISLL